MSNSISFFDSILVTIFSMSIVFLTLIAIAAIINRLKLITNSGIRITDPIIRVEGRESMDITSRSVPEVIDSKSADEETSQELIAVIAAAVASSIGADISDISIRSIRRIPQNSSVWADAGRNEQMRNKL